MSSNTPNPSSSNTATDIARSYYNSTDADTFYHSIWGGSNICVGFYSSPSEPIAAASIRTVEHMASLASPITPLTRVLDLGSGYGGAARQLAKTYGCHVTCLNLSEVENQRNRQMNREAGLEGRVDVFEGAFEKLPFLEGAFDLVWSQDAFLHSGDRVAIVAEIGRVLVKKNGKVIFSDFMAARDAEWEKLRPVLERLHLEDLGSVEFYRGEFEGRGFRDGGFEDHTEKVAVHYSRVLQELEGRSAALKGRISDEYVKKMVSGLRHWISGGQTGEIEWGILQFRR